MAAPPVRDLSLPLKPPDVIGRVAGQLSGFLLTDRYARQQALDPPSDPSNHRGAVHERPEFFEIVRFMTKRLEKFSPLPLGTGVLNRLVGVSTKEGHGGLRSVSLLPPLRSWPATVAATRSTGRASAIEQNMYYTDCRRSKTISLLIIFHMTERTDRQRHRLLQLDHVIRGLAMGEKPGTPADGWIAAARDALGMTREQLARRLGITQTSVRALELREVDGGATVGALHTAAAALGCDLVYSLVPKNGTFEGALRARAEAVATGLEADAPARPEDGGPALQREVIVQRLVAERPRSLWEEVTLSAEGRREPPPSSPTPVVERSGRKERTTRKLPPDTKATSPRAGSRSRSRSRSATVEAQLDVFS